MPIYNVLVREVHISHMKVTADDEKQAVEKVKKGAGEECTLEYSHTLDPEYWSVESGDDE